MSEKVAWFKDCIAKIKSHDQSQKVDQANELISLQKEIETLKEKQQSEMSDLLTKLAEVQTSSKNAETTNVTTDIKNTTKGCMKPDDSVNASFLRREFKISGHIRERLKRGYSENETVDAVIRAISLHSSLRSYVETLKDLSLAKLRKILRVHYPEKSASELYQTLATIFQDPKETPQQFLLRSLDLRNKVGFASKESDCEVQYDEPLIQKTFMKSFETGLRDDILAANLRPILRLPSLSDED
ncbi:Hypothetical predicted protein [Paramuricea clavata]|uniref:Uncharacterized protein n=1 Tax=Paramuricea clavata TaxID=317549 RepID=A0A6S7ILA7_PARCT|nr:Hypothetical predicted protein [Paramuricea clavata]